MSAGERDEFGDVLREWARAMSGNSGRARLARGQWQGRVGCRTESQLESQQTAARVAKILSKKRKVRVAVPVPNQTR